MPSALLRGRTAEARTGVRLASAGRTTRARTPVAIAPVASPGTATAPAGNARAVALSAAAALTAAPTPRTRAPEPRRTPALGGRGAPKTAGQHVRRPGIAPALRRTGGSQAAPPPRAETAAGDPARPVPTAVDPGARAAVDTEAPTVDPGARAAVGTEAQTVDPEARAAVDTEAQTVDPAPTAAADPGARVVPLGAPRTATAGAAGPHPAPRVGAGTSLRVSKAALVTPVPNAPPGTGPTVAAVPKDVPQPAAVTGGTPAPRTAPPGPGATGTRRTTKRPGARVRPVAPRSLFPLAPTRSCWTPRSARSCARSASWPPNSSARTWWPPAS